MFEIPILTFLKFPLMLFCFGGSQKTPSLPAVPDPSPVPVTAASPGEVASAADVKRNKIAALKFGAMSTIRNAGGAQGITGTGADLSNPNAASKKTLGA